MLLGRYYDGLELHREDKIIYAKFLSPHRVISTCRAAGGITEEVDFVFNHQTCEPAGHHESMPKSLWQDPIKYRELVAGPYGLPASKCATLGTAANMNNAAVAEESFRRHHVVVAATGGVECNAGRIGDPASVYEEDGEYLSLDQEPPLAGTINTMVFINQELTPGALVRSIVTATEAKTAALQELNVNSRYSSGLATGTGTDQVAIACRLGDAAPLGGAGKHCKLGELIGRNVKKAITQALALQNQLTPAGQCSARIHLERFGASQERMLTGICRYLDEKEAALLKENFTEIDRDPPTVAAMAALVHLWDKLTWGVLPESCRPEIMGSYGAQLAAAVSGKYERLSWYRNELAPLPGADSADDLLDLACKSMVLGFSDKWTKQD